MRNLNPKHDNYLAEMPAGAGIIPRISRHSNTMYLFSDLYT